MAAGTLLKTLVVAKQAVDAIGISSDSRYIVSVTKWAMEIVDCTSGEFLAAYKSTRGSENPVFTPLTCGSSDAGPLDLEPGVSRDIRFSRIAFTLEDSAVVLAVSEKVATTSSPYGFDTFDYLVSYRWDRARRELRLGKTSSRFRYSCMSYNRRDWWSFSPSARWALFRPTGHLVDIHSFADTPLSIPRPVMCEWLSEQVVVCIPSNMSVDHSAQKRLFTFNVAEGKEEESVNLPSQVGRIRVSADGTIVVVSGPRADRSPLWLWRQNIGCNELCFLGYINADTFCVSPSGAYIFLRLSNTYHIISTADTSFAHRKLLQWPRQARVFAKLSHVVSTADLDPTGQRTKNLVLGSLEFSPPSESFVDKAQYRDYRVTSPSPLFLTLDLRATVVTGPSNTIALCTDSEITRKFYLDSHYKPPDALFWPHVAVSPDMSFVCALGIWAQGYHQWQREDFIAVWDAKGGTLLHTFMTGSFKFHIDRLVMTSNLDIHLVYAGGCSDVYQYSDWALPLCLDKPREIAKSNGGVIPGRDFHIRDDGWVTRVLRTGGDPPTRFGPKLFWVPKAQRKAWDNAEHILVLVSDYDVNIFDLSAFM